MKFRSRVVTRIASRWRCQGARAGSTLWQERGTGILEFAFLLPFMTLMLLGVIDLGRAYYLSIEVKNAAYSGALYGVNNYTDTTGMVTAANDDAGDATKLTGWAVSATTGCECSNGDSAVSCTSAGCTYNVVNYVQVTTSVTYKPLFPWPGIPSSIALQGVSKLRTGQ